MPLRGAKLRQFEAWFWICASASLLIVLAFMIPPTYRLYQEAYRPFFGIPLEYSHEEVPEATDRVLTRNEIYQYRGDPGSRGLYLAIMGRVYDVEKGAKHYGPGQTYNMFVGHDASKAFVTGVLDSDEYATDEILMSLSTDDEFLELNHWRSFYENTYPYVGVLFGRYYDAKGYETLYRRKVTARIIQAEEAVLQRRTEKAEKEVDFPPCNLQYVSSTKNTKIWCTSKSGGRERGWVGVPRKYFTPETNNSFRCACVAEKNLNSPHLKEYPGCPSDADTCHVTLEQEYIDTTETLS